MEREAAQWGEKKLSYKSLQEAAEVLNNVKIGIACGLGAITKKVRSSFDFVTCLV